MSALEPVSFTATLMGLGELGAMDLDMEGLAFQANVFNVRHVAKAFRQERTWHSGPVFDAAPDLLAALDLADQSYPHQRGCPVLSTKGAACDCAKKTIRAAIAKARGTP